MRTKIKDFGLPNPSQNPPKILSKSRFQKTCDFSSIFARCFSFFQSSISWKSLFSHGKITNFKVFVEFVLLQFSCTFGPKNLPKTLPKRGPNPSKIDAENVLFFNIDFFGFRARFWSLLGLQLGAKLASGRSNSELEPPPWSILTWTSLQNCDWRAPGLDFKGPGLDFGSLRPRF